MCAFGGKADMTFCGCPLLRSLLGVKRTSLFAAHMSAFDPKRTLRQFGTFHCSGLSDYAALVLSLEADDEAARIPCASRRCGGRVSIRRARAAACNAGDRLPRYGVSRSIRASCGRLS